MWNSSSLECSDPFQFSLLSSLLAGFAASFCSVMGTTLNILTVVALLNYDKTRQHVTTPFIVSLACSDALFSAVTLPILAIKFFKRDWVLGQWWCQVFPVLFYANSATTLLSLMSVTLNRWALIYFGSASESRLFTRRNSKLIIVFCWLLPATLLLPSLLGIYGYHGLDCSSRSCTILDDESGNSPKSLMLLTGCFLPSFVLVMANSMILVRVKKTRRRVETQLQRVNHKGAPMGLRDRERRLALMMIIIFAAFLISYVPGAIIKILDSELSHPEWHVATYVVNWTNVLLNPLIYVATQVRYRLAFRALFSKNGALLARAETSRIDEPRGSLAMANRASNQRSSSRT